MRTMTCGAVIAVLLAPGGGAQAQAVYTPDLPTHEVSGMVGAYSLMEGGGVAGLRWTRRINPVIALEISGDHKSASSDGRNPSAVMVVAAARVAVPTPSYEPRPYITVGVARAYGFSWDVSPMIGVGVQSPWEAGVVSFRIEVQRFTSGDRRLYDRARLLIGGSVGFGKD